MIVCDVTAPAAAVLGHFEWRSADDHVKVLIMRNSMDMNFPHQCVTEGVPVGVMAMERAAERLELVVQSSH